MTKKLKGKSPKKTMQKTMKDPFAAREALKYLKPIASRELILQYLKKRGKPAVFDQVADDLNLKTEDELEALRRRLTAMCRDGQLNLNRRDGYGPLDKMNLIAGRVQGHPDGFGFLIPDDLSQDLFLNARQMRKVFDGDRVLVRIMGVDPKGRRDASIVEVLESKTQEIVGRYVKEGPAAYVIPENKRIPQSILILSDETKKAKSGEVVVVNLTVQPSEHREPAGIITEVIGDKFGPGKEVDIALRAHQIPYHWSNEVLQEIKNFNKTVSEADKKNRVDLRTLNLFTIDGEDAQDFDDAVYVEKQGKNYRLIVAIADVAHYVKPGSALDQEAMRRGTSVYFPGKVIPMLPEILSNELCSLKPNVDRLCMAADLIINPAGKIIKSQYYNAVMHSKARLTYNLVEDLLKGNNPKLKKQYKDIVPTLVQLDSLYHILLAAREKRGALDFSTVETQIVFDKDRKIEKIVPRARLESHRLIEECMLAANVAVAESLAKKKSLPILYRVHNGPKTEKITNLHSFLRELGLSLPGGEKPTPKDYAFLIEKISERPDAHLIQMMLLRSLSQAVYSPENAGHFGLAYPTYTHFTSPIRRYPDLLVHRALKQTIATDVKNKNHLYPYAQPQMIQLGEHCSLTERRADDATRDATLSLKCQFLKDKVGQVFTGVVSHVAGFGLFVELKDIFVEGLIHVTSLQNDYYQFDAAHQRLRGERTGKTYRLGDKVEVLVARVDLEQKKIDFELAAPVKATKPKKARSRTAAGKRS